MLILGTCAQRSGDRHALVKYKSDLRAKGEKLTLAELGYPREPESSGSFELLLSNANRFSGRRLDPGMLNLISLVEPGKAQVAWQMPQPPLDQSGTSKSNELTWEGYSREFLMAADTLEAIREATQTPPRYFFHDPTNWANQPPSPFVGMRRAAQWLSGDAIAALHEGDLDRARADLHALAQLARFNRDDLTLISQMIRVAIAGLGLAVTWEALQSPGWSEEALMAMQEDWESLELGNAVENGMLGERAFGEAAFSQMRSAGATAATRFGGFGPAGATTSWKDYFDAWVLMPIWKANSRDDERLFLEHHQRSLDSLRKLQSGTPWPDIDRELKAHALVLDEAFNSFFAKVRYRFSVPAIPNSMRAAKSSIRNETERRLTVTAIAIERHRLRHGRFPTDLTALTPELLSIVPLDPMCSQPLRYRLNADATFTLYSVGEDGRDDGGDPNPHSATNRLDSWSGRDAVWPVPEQRPAPVSPESAAIERLEPVRILTRRR
ncbi:MAG: hypothetical protein KJ070_04455 [Verrucomicrobia bacterium]|nr:hypothetical protein [Verrucomicrobiota bacterium]